MSAIILIPALLSFWIVARRSASAAFFNVWLPCLMLLPLYFYFRPVHLPPIGFTDAAALPIMIAIGVVHLKDWQWRPMDGLVILFVVLLCIAEACHTGLNVAGLQAFAGITSCLFPYAAGRIFLEQPAGRAVFIKRFQILLCLVAVLSAWDFMAGTSMFQRFWSPFFPGEVIEWPIQLRWGFGRIAGPYAQSIIAGMMFLTGILLSAGARHFAPHWGVRRVISIFPISIRTLVMVVLSLGLLMTQSRGPIFGLLAGLAVLQIARATNLKRASLAVAAVLLVSMYFGYSYIQEYTAGDLTSATTLEQQNAIYRKQLLKAYSGIMQEGGLLGWGPSDYPKAVGQDSIDNEYLLLAVTQGYLGVAIFACICAGTFATLIRMLPDAGGEPDKWLLFTLIAIFVGLLGTLTTVFLGAQMYQVFFLLIGWVQALRTPALEKLQKDRRSPAPFIEVYT